MKNIFMIALMLGLGTVGKVSANNIIAHNDTAKINLQVRKLNDKLIDMQAEIDKIQNRLPEERAAAEQAISNSNKYQEESRKQAASAVGGDSGDTRKAAKAAKKAANQTGDAEDASRKVEKDEKKIEDLTKDIAKIKEKILKLQQGDN